MLLKDFFETNKAAEESIIRPSLIKRRPFASAVFPLENMSATREDCEILGSTSVAPMLSITSKFLTFFSTNENIFYCASIKFNISLKKNTC